MKDWKLWALLIGLYLVGKMCGGCEGCSGCSSDEIKCRRCGQIREQAFEGSSICKVCNDELSDKQRWKEFNENCKKRERAIPVRPY